jgi:superfamily II DNA helicase RecQ
VLVVQRTGWGKSAVYFIATALLRARGAGPTVIVSPLLALMRNQIEAARASTHARTINSSNTEDWEQVYASVCAGAVDVLLVSPERLNNPEFRDQVLPRLTAAAGLIVIDQAHCISDWAHDFRPDYRRIRGLLETLRHGIPVLATTATANARVAHDVAEQFHTGAGDDVMVLRGPLDRSSLRPAATPSSPMGREVDAVVHCPFPRARRALANDPRRRASHAWTLSRECGGRQKRLCNERGPGQIFPSGCLRTRFPGKSPRR